MQRTMDEMSPNQTHPDTQGSCRSILAFRMTMSNRARQYRNRVDQRRKDGRRTAIRLGSAPRGWGKSRPGYEMGETEPHPESGR